MGNEGGVVRVGDDDAGDAFGAAISVEGVGFFGLLVDVLLEF